MGERLAGNFKDSKEMFWKEVKRVQKGESKKKKCVTDVNGEVLSDMK